MKQVSFQAVTIFWLISSAHGRFINPNDPFKAEESTVRKINKISDFHRGWSIEGDKNVEVRDPRLSELEWSAYNVPEPNGLGTYAFGYDNAMDSSGNEHYRSEERLGNGTVIGEYGYINYGINRMMRVSYTADHLGYRAKTEFLPLWSLPQKNTISN